MNRRQMLGLLLVFVVLAGIAYWQAQPPPEPNPMEALTGFNLMAQTLQFNETDLAVIRLRDPRSNFAFTIRLDAVGNWVEGDSGASLDQVEASNIAKTVALLPYRTTIPIEPSTNLADFGFLPQPFLGIDLILKDGRTHGIVVGSLTVPQEHRYATADNIQQILILERAPIDYLVAILNKPPLT